MKKIVALALSVAILSSEMQNAAATPQQPRNAEAARAGLTNLLQMNPLGGPALAKAIENLLKESYTIAPSVVASARKATPAQKAAIAVGYVRALAHLQEYDQEGARELLAALQKADPTFAAMVASLQSQYYAEAGGRAGERGDNGLGGGAGFAGGFGFGGRTSAGGDPISPN